ncbi:Transcriptional regulator, AraC family [Pseudomonas sp. R4-34-07]|nr:Transcriptional regulator, AraC family [Pseudomonas sp. R4-34-07]
MDAWVRMLRLMGDPDAIAALAPVYEREIIFRVLQGPHGWMLRETITHFKCTTSSTRILQVDHIRIHHVCNHNRYRR